ncbi:SGNH family hydrolase [Afipia sp. Root123D2]|uniref:SGNH/GDSL hydrolase family protein n=1 Tax=Afipia sp. Root123D2 TaxID=1736436 RepID=UPI0009E723C9|nr:SGNH family hydrolase [Afipia sp. Root123D2]
MRSRSPLRRILTETGPLIALAVAGMMTCGIVAPASAQFFLFGGPPQQRPLRGPPPERRGFFSPFGDMFPGRAPPEREAQRPTDYSHAPSPAKREQPAERNVLVLGDSMADWLAYGLEDALSETPELGVIRKHKTVSGLIKYQPKGEPSDWIGAAKDILAHEKPDVIVVMLGLHDRTAIREAEKKNDKADKKGAKKDGKKETKGDAKDGKPADGATAKADEKADGAGTADQSAAPAPAEDPDLQIAAPEKTRRAPDGIADFRDDRWVELYAKKIEEMVAVLKAKNVPVLWVGLPAIRGTKSTSDMLFLDSLYRDVAGKTGITYVDVWAGFVDDNGRFLTQGPDFEGQIRRLRSADGVFFTKAGARKLAHYVEREIRRVLSARLSPMAMPTDEPPADTKPGVAGPRPLYGPVMPLVASSVRSDELLGGNGTRPAAVDALAARTMVKGEALDPPAGRADDFAWPRRDVGKQEAPAGDPTVVSLKPEEPADAAPKVKRKMPASSGFIEAEDRPRQLQRPQQRGGRFYDESAPRPPTFAGPGSFFRSLFGQ